MRPLIIGVFAVAVFLLGAGWVTGRSKDIDMSSSAVIPQFMGLAALALDAVLLIGWGVWRLMTS